MTLFAALTSRVFVLSGASKHSTGKIIIDATERALHHYGSGINSVVTLGAFVRLPNDTSLLELGYGATSGTLTTVDPTTGAVSMAWHGDASLLTREPYAADAGVNVYGSSRGWGCYVVDDAVWGLVGYGCDVASASNATPATQLIRSSEGAVSITPTDALRRTLYVAPAGLLLQAEAVSFSHATLDLNATAPTLVLEFNTSGGAMVCPGLYAAVRLAASFPVVAALATVQPGSLQFVEPSPAPPLIRGAFEFPCGTSGVILSWTWIPSSS
jgi:hypothetical protein